jgi:hypothetical protein
MNDSLMVEMVKVAQSLTVKSLHRSLSPQELTFYNQLLLTMQLHAAYVELYLRSALNADIERPSNGDASKDTTTT